MSALGGVWFATTTPTTRNGSGFMGEGFFMVSFSAGCGHDHRSPGDAERCGLRPDGFRVMVTAGGRVVPFLGDVSRVRGPLPVGCAFLVGDFVVLGGVR